MRFILDVEEINYGDLAAVLLPRVSDRLRNEEGKTAKLLGKLASVPPSIANTMVDAMPESTKEDLALSLFNKNKGAILDAAARLAESEGIRLRFRDLTAEK